MNVKNPLGLSFDFLENGALQRIEVSPIRISLRSATAFSTSGANVYLRKRTNPITFKALLGPDSNSSFIIKEDTFIAKGSWDGLHYECKLQLSKKSLSWQWSVVIQNTSQTSLELDLI